MCFSAEVRADYDAFRSLFPATRLHLRAFYDLYWRRGKRPKPPVRTPKAMDALVAQTGAPSEDDIGSLIAAYNSELTSSLEQDLFAQRKRLADAERALQSKTTKKALDDQRIAGNKIKDALARLAAMQRTELRPSDARIFPGWYAPVLLIEDGQPIIRPMRYLCRPAGKPAFYDTKFPGLYNARKDNLRVFWRGQFGHTHAVMLASAFYENVARHAAEHRALRPDETAENMVLEFRPQPPQDMYIACLYSHWTPPPGADPDEPDLWSFAAVTDEPPVEVAEAGHDRCIVQLKPENVEAWLRPQGKSLDALQALLDDKSERPYYEHRKAA